MDEQPQQPQTPPPQAAAPEPQEEQGAPTGCLIALYMLPVFAAAGIGIMHLSKKMDPSVVKMTESDSSAFETNLPAADEVLLSTDPVVRAAQLAKSSATAEAEETGEEITLDAVEKLVGKPVSLRKLLNSLPATEALLTQPNTMSLLKSKVKLEAYLAGSPEVGLFLFSPAITALSADRRSMDAALSSQLVGRVGNTKAVQALLHDQKSLVKTVKANPQLAAFLKQPEVSAALAAFSKSGVLEGLDTPAVAELIKPEPAKPEANKKP